MRKSKPINKIMSTHSTRSRRIRLSAMHLLAAGALAGAGSAQAQANVTNAINFGTVLNTDEDINFLNDVDLLGSNFNIGVRTQFFGDGGVRTVSNGTLTVTGSTSATNYTLFNPTPTVILDNLQVRLNTFSRMDLDSPTTLGATGTVRADDNADIRLFTDAMGANLWDPAFFAKFSLAPEATAGLISFSVVGDGVSTLTGLPTFDAQINLNQYNDFGDFAADPAIDPTLTLGANLTGNNAVAVNFGTLNLNNFNFTIDSLTGAAGTAVTLGTGTLTVDSGDYAGVISGAGNVTKNGPGTLTLSGINTYTGNTLVIGGILNVDGELAGTTALNLDGSTVNLNGDVNDAVVVDVDAASTLNLNNLNQTFGSITGAGAINLNNASLTAGGDGSTTTFSGIIAGNGGLTKEGAGNLTLSGANTYTGATNLNAGNLILGAGGSLNSAAINIAAGTTFTVNGDLNDATALTVAPTGTVDLSGATQTVGSINGGGDIALGANTLTVGSGTFTGDISGTGGLTKNGTGTLTFGANQTFTGATLISSGTLTLNNTFDMATSGATVQNGATFVLNGGTFSVGGVTVDAGGTFFGNGNVAGNVANDGTTSFARGTASTTLVVGGNFVNNASGTIDYRLSTPIVLGLDITGSLTLDGTLNVLGPLDPANFNTSAGPFVIFEADGGITEAVGFTVQDDFFFLDVTTNINGNNYEIDLARNAVTYSTAAAGGSTNQQTIATVLDTLFPAPAVPVFPGANELEQTIIAINNGSQAQALTAFDQLAGGVAATASAQLAAFAATQSSRVLDQVVGVTPGSTRSLTSFSEQTSNNQARDISDFDSAEHLTLLSMTPQRTSRAANRPAPGLVPTAWGSIHGGFGEQGDGAESLEYTRFGAILGLEADSVESSARYGVSLSVEQSDFDFDEVGGNMDVTSFYVSGYTRQPLGGNFYAALVGAFGYHSHESTRTITALPAQASADFNSYSITVAGELSRSYAIIRTSPDPGNHPTDTTFEPFIRATYSLSSQDGYNETGAGAAGLSVDSEEFDSFRISGGIRAQHQYMMFNRYDAVLKGRAMIDGAISNSDADLNVALIGSPANSFAIEGSDQDDLFGVVGVGFSVGIGGNWDMHLDLDQQFSGEGHGTLFSAGLSFSF